MRTPSTDFDRVTGLDMLKAFPNFAAKLPHILKGLVYANDTRTTKPMGLASCFERAVQKNPHGIALKFLNQTWTYQQLNEHANRIAHHLLDVGFKKGDTIAVCIENRPEMLMVAVALAKIGVASALINTSQVGKVLEHSINLVKPKAMIAGSEMMDQLEGILGNLRIADNLRYWLPDPTCGASPAQCPNGFTELLKECAACETSDLPNSKNIYFKDPLFYIFTSGTTGLPKAVVFTNGRFMRSYGTYGHVMNLNRTDVMFVTLPFYHATGMVVCWSCVLAGYSTLALGRKFSAREFVPNLHRYGATCIGYVGELCRYLMEVSPTEDDTTHTVRKMIGNGLRPNVWQAFKTRFNIPNVFEFYASSEGSVGFSNIFNQESTMGFTHMPYAVVQYDQEKDAPVRDKNGFMIPVKVGEVGLLLGQITRTTPFDGYTDKKSTEKVVWTNVLKKGDKYFNSNDLVRQLGFRHTQFVDRLGDTYRWKGENVSTNEVENLLCTHPKIAEAVAYGVEINNTNGRAGMSVIVPHEDEQIVAEDMPQMLKHFKATMPSYAIPVFLRVQAKPETTSTFKYPKQKLKTEAFDPNLVSDPIYVWLPGSENYVLINQELYQSIQTSQFRF